MKLKNKTVLVTASTRGIGLAIVKKCAKEGATVYMAARNPERAEKLAEELCREGYAVTAVFHDAMKLPHYIPKRSKPSQKNQSGEVVSCCLLADRADCSGHSDIKSLHTFYSQFG